VDRPRTIYVRESQIVPALDTWLARVIHPEHREETLDALVASQTESVADEARLAAARRALAECDAKLDRYRRALEAGTDPAVVAAWIREVTETRRRTEREMRLAAPARCGAERSCGRSSRPWETSSASCARPILRRRRSCTGGLGLALTYGPDARRVTVEADLAMCGDRVGGGT
jgi:site-specific DNA recombinase